MFAVRFKFASEHALWVLVEDSNKSASTLKVGVNDLIKGIRSTLWNEVAYMLHPRLLIVSVFDKEFEGKGAIHSEYGTETMLNIIIDEKTNSFAHTEATLIGSFFQCFNLEEVRVETDGAKTYQYLRPTLTSCFLADIVYRMNRQFIDENGRLSYDPTRELVLSDQKLRRSSLANRDMVQKVAHLLIQEDVIFLFGIGTETESWLKWQHCFGDIKS